MARIINYFLNNTVLGLDKILNKALKTYKLLIIFWLVNIYYRPKNTSGINNKTIKARP
jgi:hypothetical protein